MRSWERSNVVFCGTVRVFGDFGYCRTLLKRWYFLFLLMTEKAAKPTGEIHVKTLEEIRLERANQRRGEPPAKPQAEGWSKAEDPNSGARPSAAVRIKTFSGALAEKNHKRLEEEKQKPDEFPIKTKAENEPKKQNALAPSTPSKAQPAEPAGKARLAGEVRVKTLEEIKKEKALRMQQSGENVPGLPAQPKPAPAGRRLLRITKLIGNKVVWYLLCESASPVKQFSLLRIHFPFSVY